MSKCKRNIFYLQNWIGHQLILIHKDDILFSILEIAKVQWLNQFAIPHPSPVMKSKTDGLKEKLYVIIRE